MFATHLLISAIFLAMDGGTQAMVQTGAAMLADSVVQASVAAQAVVDPLQEPLQIGSVVAHGTTDAGPSAPKFYPPTQAPGYLFDPQPENAGGIVSTLLVAVKNKWWGFVAASVLSMLLLLLRLWKPSVQSHYVKLAAALMATLPALIVILGKPGVDVNDVIATAIQSVLMAGGLWTMVLKDFGGSHLVEIRATTVAENSVPEVLK